MGVLNRIVLAAAIAGCAAVVLGGEGAAQGVANGGKNAAAPHAVAAQGKVDDGKVYPVPPDKMDEFNARTGGLVEAPSNAKKLVLLDGRRKDASELENLAQGAESLLAVMCEVRGAAEALETFDQAHRAAFKAKSGGAGAVVVFCELDGDASVLAAFPEDGIAIVNLAPLASDDYNTYRRRMVKEYWRSLAFALGGYGNASQMGTAVQPVFSVAELDAVKGFGLSPMHIGAIKMAKARLGLFGRRAVPYTRAMVEGWAPPPTNDAQRAVWARFNNEKEQGPAVQRPITRRRRAK